MQDLSLPRIVFIIGPPGSGKGTQSAKILANYSFQHLSTGDLLRAQMSLDTPRAKQIRELMGEGKLISSQIVVELLIKKFKELGNVDYLLDGFPRNQQNLGTFRRLLGGSVKVVGCLYFQCKNQTLVSRLLKRGAESGRSDDKKQIIALRINTYQSQTRPFIEQLQRGGEKVERVNCERSAQQIYEDVSKSLQSFGYRM